VNIALKKIYNSFNYQVLVENRFDVYREQTDLSQDTFADDVYSGLKSLPKKLAPKYFYDDKGSDLFVKITNTQEYYPTRTEKKILSECADELKNICSNVEILAELGSGSSEKTRILLDTFTSENNRISYFPIDVSDIILSSSQELLNLYDTLDISGIISDYENGLSLLSKYDDQSKLVIFLGSSIGNFDPHEAETFMKGIAEALNKNDFLLVGFDLVKSPEVLNRAYNDTSGYTEAFNLNILERINRQLNGQFEVNNFQHKAFFNNMASRIEMHLESKVDQDVPISLMNTTVNFKKGETIHTENSYKFTDELIKNLTTQAGFNIIKTWKDPNNYFALTLLSLT